MRPMRREGLELTRSQDTVRIGGIHGSEIVDLRRGPDGVVHVLTNSEDVVAVDGCHRDSTTIEFGESSYGAPGPSHGYALTNRCRSRGCAPRLKRTEGRDSRELASSSGCFEFELCDSRRFALSDHARPWEDPRALPCGSRVRERRAKPGTGRRPSPIEMSGGGLRVLRSAFERGSAEAVVY